MLTYFLLSLLSDRYHTCVGASHGDTKPTEPVSAEEPGADRRGCTTFRAIGQRVGASSSLQKISLTTLMSIRR